MTAANLAVLLASGCSWANIRAEGVLVIDMDTVAPGIHFYDFLGAVRNLSVLARSWGDTYCRLRGLTYETSEALLAAIQAGNIGFIHWLTAVLQSAELQVMLRAAPPTSEDATRSLFFAASNATHRLLRSVRGNVDDPRNPWFHIVEVRRSSTGERLCILPAGDPKQPGYRAALGALSWDQFISRFGGLAVLSELLLFAGGPSAEPGTLPITRILLDQDAGRSLGAQLNERLSDFRVVVTGHNEQSCAGLGAVLSDETSCLDPSRLFVVVSQYDGRTQLRAEARHVRQGRPEAEVWERWQGFSWDYFRSVERQRHKLLDQLHASRVRRDHIVTTDFESNAIQREFFYSPGTPSHDALVQLAVAIERQLAGGSDAPAESLRIRVVGSHRPVRILGELVEAKGRLAGPIEAFRQFAATVLGAEKLTAGLAAPHKLIAEMATSGKRVLRGAAPGESIWNPGSLTRSVSDGRDVELQEFDVVALPVYVLQNAQAWLHPLRLPPVGSPEDSLRAVGEEYWQDSILGWRRYARLPRSPREAVIGVPLFVECSLLVMHPQTAAPAGFAKRFRDYEARDFEGFHNPADILAVARQAALSDGQHEGLLLMLRPEELDQWYEWQTVVASFGGVTPNDRSVVADAAHWSDDGFSRYQRQSLVTATRYYLELASYSESASDSSGWPDVVNHVENRRAGFAFVWPDGVPGSARSPNSGLRFFVPPGDAHNEDAWLLCVPRERGPGSIPTEDLERLLAKFLTARGQAVYQQAGGIASHRRVLADPLHWTDCAFLPQLLRLLKADSRLPRAASESAFRTARSVAKVLEDLRQITSRKLSDRCGASGRRRYPSAWADRDFIQGIEQDIRDKFDELSKRLRAG